MLEAAQDEQRFTGEVDFTKIDETIKTINEKVDTIQAIIANYSKGNFDQIPVETEEPITVTTS